MPVFAPSIFSQNVGLLECPLGLSISNYDGDTRQVNVNVLHAQHITCVCTKVYYSTGARDKWEIAIL